MINQDHAEFLANRHKHRKMCVSHVRWILLKELDLADNLSDLSIPEQRVLEQAATHVIDTINYAGWDFMFDEKDEFIGMVL